MRNVSGLAAALVLAAVLAGCTRVTQENFDRIEVGMRETEVHAILGPPDDSANAALLRVKAVNSRWVSRDATITIQFVNERVRVKSMTGREPRL